MVGVLEIKALKISIKNSMFWNWLKFELPLNSLYGEKKS